MNVSFSLWAMIEILGKSEPRVETHLTSPLASVASKRRSHLDRTRTTGKLSGGTLRAYLCRMQAFSSGLPVFAFDLQSFEDKAPMSHHICRTYSREGKTTSEDARGGNKDRTRAKYQLLCRNGPIEDCDTTRSNKSKTSTCIYSKL